MREMVKPHSCKPASASSELPMRKDPQVTSKLKPKIRIVHVYAPEIIKTDAANFRELVQRLTGKPEETKGNVNKTTTPPSKSIMGIDMETHSEFANFQNGMRIEEQDEELWRNEKLSGFFDGFSDLDGFIEELSELPVQ